MICFISRAMEEASLLFPNKPGRDEGRRDEESRRFFKANRFFSPKVICEEEKEGETFLTL